MKKTTRSAFFAIAFLFFIFGSGMLAAQNSRSVSINLVGVVPPRLEMSLSFGQGNVVALEGRGPDVVGASGAFTVSAGTEVELGYANVFSNLIGSFSIVVMSENGGVLREETGSGGATVPYNLSFDGQHAKAVGGTFSFVKSGKTEKAGTPIRVALGFGSVPESAKDAILTDRLMFSLSAH